MSEGDYFFRSVPVSPVPPGTNILVEGPYHAGTRDLASRLLTPGEKEAQVIVSTNSNAGRFYREWQGLGLDFGEQTAILDCVSTAEPDLPARIHHVSGPQDLTGITIRLSKAYQEFYRDSLSRIRLGIFSVSTMLTIGDVRPVFRFVNTVAGRISNFGGSACSWSTPRLMTSGLSKPWPSSPTAASRCGKLETQSSYGRWACPQGPGTGGLSNCDPGLADEPSQASVGRRISARPKFQVEVPPSGPSGR